MRSSYIKNNYGKLFEALAAIHKPSLVVECGVLDGYSLIALAKGAGPKALVCGIDIFEDYAYKHGSQKEVQDKLNKEGLSSVQLIHKDAFAASDEFKDDSIDILHCDIANDSFKLTMFLSVWKSKIKKDGLFIYEGGSWERDDVDWMMKYKKSPIRKFTNHLAKNGFEFITFSPFPSLTVCRKK